MSGQDNKRTTGQIIYDHQSKQTDTANPLDIQEQTHSDFVDNVKEALERGKKSLGNMNLYVVVITKKDATLSGVDRNRFFYRKSCPTPTPNQIVYHYDKKDDTLSLVWTLPDKVSCATLFNNQHEAYLYESELVDYVVDYMHGKLREKCLRLNKEKHTGSSNLII